MSTSILAAEERHDTAHAGMKVVAYIRVSTDDHDQRPERQTEYLADYAAREGIQVVEWVIDEGTSAFKVDPLNRTKVHRAIKLAAQHKATGILVEDLDRWCRSGHKVMATTDVRLELEYGLEVIMAKMPKGENGLVYELMKTIKAYMAEEYSRQMGIRIREGLRLAKKNGWPKGKPGAPPKDELTNEEMAMVVDWKASMGWRKVAVRLNHQRGVFEIADTTLRRKRHVSEAWLRTQVAQREKKGCVLARTLASKEKTPKKRARKEVDSTQGVGA